MRHCDLSVKVAFHVLLSNLISYVTSGQTVMWNMTVPRSSCYELFIIIMILACCLQCTFDLFTKNGFSVLSHLVCV
jgi:hypothetical protein